MGRLPLLFVLGVCLGTWARGEPVVVTGKVVDAVGQPVPAADVWTTYYDDAGRHRVATTTDPRGDFRLEWHLDRPHPVDLLATAPDLTVVKLDCDPKAPQPVLIRLAPEAFVHGVIGGADGAPIAGATVLLRSCLPPGAEPDDRALRAFLAPECPIRTTTDAQGRFRIGHVPDGATVELMVEAEGFARWTPWMGPKEPEAKAGAADDYAITLSRAAIVEGVVRHDGRPVAGVRVHAAPVGAAEGWDEDRSDEEGAYRLTRLGAGTYNIILDPPEGLTARAHTEVTVAQGDRVPGLDFDLTPGALIEGRVVDPDTGAAVGGGQVASYGPMRPSTSGTCLSVRADDEGRYRLRVAPGTNRVYYQGGRFEYLTGEDASLEIDVVEGQTVQAPDLRVKRGAAVTVRVVGPDGVLEPGATVEWQASWGAVPRTADAQGQCEFGGFRAGAPAIFTARDPASKLLGAALVEAIDPEQPITITLLPRASVQLRLVDPAGDPLAGITVRATVTVEVREVQDGHGRWEPGAYASLASAQSDEHGRVRFADLPAGLSPRFALDTKTNNRVEWPEALPLRPGAESDLGDVFLDVQKVEVQGTVVDERGQPVPGAFVTLNEWTAQAKRTDAQGRFTIGDLLPDEEVPILAASPDRKRFGAERFVPTWGLEPAIMLAAPVGVKGVLTRGDGTPISDRKVQLYPTSGGRVEGFPLTGETTTAADGSFTFDPVVAGAEYDFLVRRPGTQGSWIVLTFVPEAGGETDLGAVATVGE